jgi:hypothetical protein
MTETTESSRAQMWFAVTALVSLAVFAQVATSPNILHDADTNWHIATGRWILSHRAVPHVDVFSYTAPGRPWVTIEWLSETIMAAAYGLAGWSGILVLFGLAAALVAAQQTLFALKWLSPAYAAALATLSFICMAPYVLARPHLIAAPILAFWTIRLLTARAADRAPDWWMVPIMAVWANLHGSFAMGLALTCGFALEAVLASRGRRLGVARAWGLFLVACLASALVTPHGFRGFELPVSILHMTTLYAISEWRSASFSQPTIFEMVLVATMFVCFTRGVRLNVVRTLMLLGLLHMALQHIRQQLVFGVVTPLLLAEPLGQALSCGPPRNLLSVLRARFRSEVAPGAFALLVVFAVVVGARLAFPVRQPDGINTPVTAIQRVPGWVRTQPVFNEYGFGGLLLFNGVRPFIDGRSDMYGDAFVREYIDTSAGDPKTVAAAFSKYHVRWTILDPHSPVVRAVDTMPGWRRVYADKWAVVQLGPRMGS